MTDTFLEFDESRKWSDNIGKELGINAGDQTPLTGWIYADQYYIEQISDGAHGVALSLVLGNQDWYVPLVIGEWMHFADTLQAFEIELYKYARDEQ